MWSFRCVFTLSVYYVIYETLKVRDEWNGLIIVWFKVAVNKYDSQDHTDEQTLNSSELVKFQYK